jgi:hypothetical protein
MHMRPDGAIWHSGLPPFTTDEDEFIAECTNRLVTHVERRRSRAHAFGARFRLSIKRGGIGRSEMRKSKVPGLWKLRTEVRGPDRQGLTLSRSYPPAVRRFPSTESGRDSEARKLNLFDA